MALDSPTQQQSPEASGPSLKDQVSSKFSEEAHSVGNFFHKVHEAAAPKVEAAAHAIKPHVDAAARVIKPQVDHATQIVKAEAQDYGHSANAVAHGKGNAHDKQNVENMKHVAEGAATIFLPHVVITKKIVEGVVNEAEKHQSQAQASQGQGVDHGQSKR